MSKKSSAVFILFAASSCGPIQGYPGPKLPDNRVAIIERHCFEHEISDTTVDGQSFCMQSIAVLPGTHSFFTAFQTDSAPYDCETHREFDYYGYDSCRNDREEDIRKGRSPRICNYSSYDKSVTNCTVDYVSYNCSLIFSVSAGDKYMITGYPESGSSKQGAALIKNSRPVAQFDCIRLRAWSGQVTQ